MHLVMTIPSCRGALHILALIALDEFERPKIGTYRDNIPHHTAAGVRIPILCSKNTPVMHNVPNIDPNNTAISPHSTTETSVLIASNFSSSSSSSSSSPFAVRSNRKTRSSRKNNHDKAHTAGSQQSTIELKKKLELRSKRIQTIEKAKKISSLDNSPANDRQLHVLRMVYDEITMYPAEPWIAILAIIIHRYTINDYYIRSADTDDFIAHSSDHSSKLRIGSPMSDKNAAQAKKVLSPHRSGKRFASGPSPVIAAVTGRTNGLRKL